MGQPQDADHESPDPLDMLRHSTAHVMAAAVTQLFPGAKYGIGPPILDGFYYDFDLGNGSLSDSDLPAIEERMRQLIKQDLPFEHEMMPRQSAVEAFKSRGQDYKLELIDERVQGPEVSVYHTGEFLDLCRGPHVPSTGAISAFKLLKVAGAYWKADERNPMLVRIYGTAWPTQRDLDDYLRFLEEAEKRDHKRLNRDLRLFLLDERTGGGLPIWLPAGATIRRELSRWIEDEELARGYQHVISPHIAKVDLYRVSGHYQLYKDLNYPAMKFPEGDEMMLRPMNCPHHVLVYQSELRSYRELPLRIAEVGQVYRYEKSGELAGLIRVRSFAINDAHIFCTPEQLVSEIEGVMDLVQHVYRVLGIDEYWFRLSVKDDVKDKWLGTDDAWRNAESALSLAMDKMGLRYEVGVGDAAFYGPKVDLQVRDALRREYTASTVQVDFNFPEKFDLEYVAEDGTRKRPVMIHRGPVGSLERMTAYMIEKFAGAFPVWLSPVQVAVIPITDTQLGYAREVTARLRRSRLRVELDDRSERMQRKIRDAQTKKVPYMAVVGAREEEAGQVSVRDRAGNQAAERLEVFADRVAAEVAAKA